MVMSKIETFIIIFNHGAEARFGVALTYPLPKDNCNIKSCEQLMRAGMTGSSERKRAVI